MKARDGLFNHYMQLGVICLMRTEAFFYTHNDKRLLLFSLMAEQSARL